MDEHVNRVAFDPGEQRDSQPGKVRPSRAKWAILALVMAGVGLIVVATHQRAPRERARPAAPAQPVGIATIGTGDIRIILNELGTVTPLDTVTVKTQVNGQVMQMPFREGQLVKKGQLLVQIDDRPYQAQLEKDQGQLAHDQGLLAQAKADLKRYEQEARTNSIALQTVDDERYLVQQDTGTVKSDQGTVATDELNIAYAHIVSPVDGRVGLRQVDPGNYVQTTDTNGLVVITQLQPMSVVFAVPQQNVAAVEERMAQGATLPVDAYDQTNTTKLDEGKLAAIDTEINTSTGTVNMRALFPNKKNQLFPDEFVNAHLLVNTLTNVVRVPVAAVQIGAPGPYVWVVNQNDTVTVRPVKLGPEDGQFRQVISGLQPGVRVVTDGTDRLRDGMKVTIPTAAHATSPAAQPTTHHKHHAPASSTGARPE